jgi:hypothetical protein
MTDTFNSPSLVFAFALLVGVSMAACASSQAETLMLNCTEKSFGKTSDLTLTYDGNGSGTLKVKGSYGEMALPASKEERTDKSGAKVTGIRASGPATVLMPDKAAIEACVTGRGYAEIAIMEPPSAYVFVTRTYLESTTLAGGTIKLDTLPPPNCSLAQ